ncbi:MAG TPA: hypothetical protein VE710_00065 [Candidatus Bathyarchaeia archaeon]|nr:hypothetical protein [Candidatus Bathyarchaeia archaeon]
MDHKLFYYVTNWDDASAYTRALETMDIPYSLEAPGDSVPLHEGELAIVFPHLRMRQYKAVRELIHLPEEPYPDH